MKSFNWGAVVFSVLIALQGIGGGYAHAAGEIHFLIKVGATENEVAVGQPNTRLNLQPSYTVGGVTINFAPVSGASAYIDLNEAGEWLVLKNAKISSASILNEVKFTFWREFSAPPSGAGVTYHIQAGGLFKRGALAADGARVSFRGTISEGGTSLGVIQSRTLPPPIVCPAPQSLDPTTRCIVAPNSTIAWNTVADSSLFTLNADPAVKHVLKAMFWVKTVQTTDVLQFNDTATSGIHMGGGPPSGPGGTTDLCDTCKKEECDTCLIEGRRCPHVKP